MIESEAAPRNLIEGEWVPADSGEAAEVRDPACPSATRLMNPAAYGWSTGGSRRPRL